MTPKPGHARDDEQLECLTCNVFPANDLSRLIVGDPVMMSTSTPRSLWIAVSEWLAAVDCSLSTIVWRTAAIATYELRPSNLDDGTALTLIASLDRSYANWTYLSPILDHVTASPKTRRLATLCIGRLGEARTPPC